MDRKRSYRQLLNKVDELTEQEDLGTNTVNSLLEIQKRLGLLYDQESLVRNADERILDSLISARASGLVATCVSSLNICSSTYEPSEFAPRILGHVNDSKENSDGKTMWLKLLKTARRIVPEVPKYSFLSGAMDPQVIEQKQRKTVVREAKGPVQKKELLAVSAVEKEEEGVNDTVNYLFKCLLEEFKDSENNHIDYYKFIIDTHDFGRTVENIFYFSFLIRDGRAMMTMENNVPHVGPVKKKDLKNFRNKGGENTQVITSIDFQLWQQFKFEEGCVQKYRRQQKVFP